MDGRLQFNLADFLLATAAVPLWGAAVMLLGSSTGWGGSNGYVIVLLVLGGMTFALNRLTRRLAVAMFAAPFCAVLPILVVAWFAGGL